jgi:hypothetical protein
MKTQNNESNPAVREAADAAAEAVIALIDEFITVVREENAMLARGLPASLSSAAQRKMELAEAFEVWVNAATARAFRIDNASAPLRKRFLERLAFFQETMNANIAHLEAAMEASRRRIDAVMAAIRSEMVDASPYGANGKTYHVSSSNAMRAGTYI